MPKIRVKGPIVSNDEKWIYDWFGIEAVSPADIDAQLEAAGGEEVELEINSGGGDVYAGAEIYTALKQYSGNSIAKIVGIAASAASVLAMGAKKILISPPAQMMVHNVWTRAEGDYREMEHEAVVLKGWNKSIANAYALKTGMEMGELLKLMNNTTWLTAQDAVKMGFADEIMFDEGAKLAASTTMAGMLPQEVVNKIRNMIKAEALKQEQQPAEPAPETQDPPTEPEAPGAPAPVDLYDKLIKNNERRFKSC